MIPPLRTRSEDITLLINYFLGQYPKVKFNAKLQEFLADYEWPGNVRELENVVNYLANVVYPNEIASVDHLPAYILPHETESRLGHGETDNFLELLRCEINNHAAADVVQKILYEINQAGLLRNGIGRKKLLSRIEQGGYLLSENKLRKWLEIFGEKGLITIGTTRQGSKITAKGVSLLHCLSKKTVD